jgi:hypothetical protein
MRFAACSKGAPEAAAGPSLPCQRAPSPGTIDIKAIIRLDGATQPVRVDLEAVRHRTAQQLVAVLDGLAHLPF